MAERSETTVLALGPTPLFGLLQNNAPGFTPTCAQDGSRMGCGVPDGGRLERRSDAASGGMLGDRLPPTVRGVNRGLLTIDNCRDRLAL